MEHVRRTAAACGREGNDVTYRLLAMDLDGTVIGNDLVITDRVKQAVRRAIEAGMIVTLATGRMYQGTLRFAKELDIYQPLVCYQGAMIRHAVTNELWFHEPVPIEVAREVIEIAEGQGKVVVGFVDDQCYVSRDTPESRFYHHHSGVEPRIVGDLQAWLPEAPTKVLIITAQEETDVTLAFFRERFARQLNATRSYPLFTELTRENVSKGRALTQLCARLMIDPAEVAAIGDNLNDLDMIQFAGFGVAMGNGSAPVKAAAAFVAPTQAEDGVAVAIEEQILAHAPVPPSSPLHVRGAGS